MRKLMEKQYNRILMQPGNPGWMDRQILALANYILFPEFRKRSYGKYFKWCMYGLLSYFILAMSVDVMYVRGELDKRNNELYAAYNKVDYLLDNAQGYVYDQVMDSFMVSEDYLRYKMYDETGIIIPERVSEQHLKAIAELSAEKKVPLNIYLRVIYHESRFDSSAVNKSSGAFGYCQTMPVTFNHFYSAMKLEGGKTAINNLTIGAELLAKKFNYWVERGRNDTDAWEMALACYAMGDSLPRAMNAVPNSVRPYVNYVLYQKEL